MFVTGTSFGQVLAQTIQWCEPRARRDLPSASLRSERLRPWSLARDRFAVVSHLIAIRQNQLLGSPHVPDARSADDLHGGRLLVHFPGDTMFEEASWAASGGFFDEVDAPPWDTWIAARADGKRDYLVSWVPPMFFELAQLGIEVNSTSCIRWLEDAPVADELARFCVR